MSTEDKEKNEEGKGLGTEKITDSVPPSKEVPPSTSVGVLEVPRMSEKITTPSGREVVILEMTAIEESRMRDLAKVRTGEAIESVLEACVEGVSRKEILRMTRGDRVYIMISLRTLSYGEGYEFKFMCPMCQASGRKKINLNDLPIVRADKDAPSKVTLPRSGWELEIRQLTGEDEHKLIAQGRDDPDSRVAYEMYLATVSVNGQSKESAGGLPVFKKLSGMDCVAFRSALDDITDGVDVQVEVDCNVCSVVSTVLVPFDASFFYPGT